jgi:hypothetical protein
MTMNYGQKGYRIGIDNISSINLTSCTLSSSSNNGKGSGSWVFLTQDVACGSTGFNLIINDNTIPTSWSNISWKTEVVGKTSCWNFANDNNSNGNGTHNILSYSEANGDLVRRAENSFELPQFTTPMSRCDNLSTNFNHGTYAVGSSRFWTMNRRRNGTNTAGPAAGFACISTVGNCTISEVMVW